MQITREGLRKHVNISKLTKSIKIMKKTLFALFALGSVASAALTDGLQWAQSFGDGFDQEATFTINNAFHVENGVGVAGGEYDDSRIWTTNLSGGNFIYEFTFSFKLVDFDAANWTNALAMYTHGEKSGTNHSLQLQKNANSQLMIYTENFTGSNVADDASNINLGKIDDLKGKQITLTLSATKTETGTTPSLTAYVDGIALADTITFTYAEGATPSTALTGFQFGAAFGGSRVSNSVTVDNIGVWNRALSAEEVASLPIPEPTTAALSLLALAGLAARRRR